MSPTWADLELFRVIPRVSNNESRLDVQYNPGPPNTAHPTLTAPAQITARATPLPRYRANLDLRTAASSEKGLLSIHSDHLSSAKPPYPIIRQPDRAQMIQSEVRRHKPPPTTLMLHIHIATSE